MAINICTFTKNVALSFNLNGAVMQQQDNEMAALLSSTPPCDVVLYECQTHPHWFRMCGGIVLSMGYCIKTVVGWYVLTDAVPFQAVCRGFTRLSALPHWRRNVTC